MVIVNNTGMLLQYLYILGLTCRIYIATVIAIRFFTYHSSEYSTVNIKTLATEKVSKALSNIPVKTQGAYWGITRNTPLLLL